MTDQLASEMAESQRRFDQAIDCLRAGKAASVTMVVRIPPGETLEAIEHGFVRELLDEVYSARKLVAEAARQAGIKCKPPLWRRVLGLTPPPKL